ncbi:MAG: repressor LexA [Candidatus Moranbacteria bacterium CG06_land_8_20_14_3_00_40_12]|uniref:Repressor LexA n=1 Tax=Candidatus Nealsonbacteria bacterium CG23_combo_of_CG06-09_8_20_14_all_37_18 TaxID=1974720 RepID=A0A2G9YZ09_9BACT|nr:MAG: repressor LexA [Candidatus Nealsonbacteria bacterium CG23_combo_of_CG06-09_8_20_14_all_37_18]PIU80560.1 MAG: repressor LexA [Candidatus Moranbacteria bacterium CG06_land_8_20_14_3_00_40_12]
MSIKLTPKQKKVLELIYNSLETSGFPPTLADLKEKLGVASNQSVLNFLDILEKKEYIKREEGQARGIRILPLGYKEIGKDPLNKMAGVSAAGSYIESFADTFSSWMTLPGQVLQNEEIKQAQDEVFVIQVQGDSMINANICDSDMLLVKKTKEYKNGDIVVARSDDGTTVKRFVAEEGRTYLKPENPNYKNIPIFPETIFEGKVILNLTKVNA